MEGSLAISGSDSVAGVTTFSNEACEGVVVNKNYVPSSLTITQPDIQDITTYFSRPRLISRGVLALGTRTNVTSDYVNITTLRTWFPQFQQRMSGAYGFRFSLNFKLQVATTPFHQGLINVNWQYSADAASGVLFTRNSFTAASTNLPHVRLDLSENTMAEFKVPFLYSNEFMQLEGGSDLAYGNWGINTMLPIVSVVGLSAPTYELYLFLTDIELFGVDNNNPTTITLQSGLSTIGSELKKSHLLSSTLDQATKISRFVSRNIPSLSSIAGPVGWATDVAAGVARYFGYARPLIQDPVLRVMRSIYNSDGQVDLPFAGFPVGLFQSNTLAVSPEFGATDVDEMALAYITSQWSQICVGFVNTTNTHGMAVYASPVSPACFWFRAPVVSPPYCNIMFPRNNLFSVSAANSFLPSSLMNISSFFRLWRGSIKYRFTFAKSKFHGGRYMVSFNPSNIQKTDAFSGYANIEGPEVTSGTVQPYGYSTIMDLRDSNVFEFEVPYMIGAPYTTFASSVGGISIVCIDPLQATSTVTTSVPFLVEVCGGSDFELADFGGPWFQPLIGGTISQQSGGTVSKTTKTANQLVVGEHITSVKQMIQSPSWIKVTVAAATTIKAILYPWFISSPINQLFVAKAVPMPANLIVRLNTTCSNLAKMYAFVRGGTDYHIYPGLNGRTRIIADQSVTDAYSAYTTTNNDTCSRTAIGSTPKVVTYGEHPMHVRLPAFQTRVRIPSHIFDVRTYPAFGDAGDYICQNARSHTDRCTVINGDSSVPTDIWVSKSASDDAMLACYIGPLPVMIPNSTSSTLTDQDWYT